MKKYLAIFNRHLPIHSDPNRYLPILKKSNFFGSVKYWLILVKHQYDLYNCFNKMLPNVTSKLFYNLKIVWVTFFDLKDSIPKEVCSHIVYKFPCSNCSITYYGETERIILMWGPENILVGQLEQLNVLITTKNQQSKTTAYFLITWVCLKISQFWWMSQILSNFWLNKHY